MSEQAIYRKSRRNAPAGFFDAEAAGLRWLGDAERHHHGVRTVRVEGVGRTWLDIERINPAVPTADAAFEFGARLAKTHDAGADAWGCSPEGYEGTCYFGPLQDPLPLEPRTWGTCADYYAYGRLMPMLETAIGRGALDERDDAQAKEIIAALPQLLGEAGNDRPARLHGDLWNGNVLWTLKKDADSESRSDQMAVEAVLIDPAAHGGHREEDLAMLDLFGAPYEEAIFRGYQSAHPLAKGWAQRIRLWQLVPLAAHCAFFGGSYVDEYRSCVRGVLASIEQRLY